MEKQTPSGSFLDWKTLNLVGSKCVGKAVKIGYRQ